MTEPLDAQFGAGACAAFVEKFGSDLSAALLKPTGKKSAAGEGMYVWQDYVALGSSTSFI